jgi:hypothetical protein
MVAVLRKGVATRLKIEPIGMISGQVAFHGSLDIPQFGCARCGTAEPFIVKQFKRLKLASLLKGVKYFFVEGFLISAGRQEVVP